MNLRLKTLLITSTVLLTAILVIFLYSHYFLLASFNRLEVELMEKNASRTTAVLNNRLDELSRVTRDYASWDDTYAFIVDHNERYIKTNLINATFTNLKINLMAFIDKSGQVVFAKGYDLDTDKEAPFPPTFLAGNSIIASFHKTPLERHQGLLILPQGILLLASQPILTSAYVGPARGVLIFGRFIDRGILELLNRSAELPVSINQLNDPRLPADCRKAWQKMVAAKTVNSAAPLDDKQISGYSLFNDLTGQPAVIIRTTSPRKIYAEGYNTLVLYQTFLVAIGLIATGLLALFLEKFILARLFKINQDINQIGASGNLAARLPIKGKDELTAVSAEINRMLSSLQSARNAERASEQRFQTLFEAGPDAIFLEELNGKIVDCNSVAAQISGYSRGELQKLTAADLTTAEVAANFPSIVEQENTRGSFQIETVNQRKNGELYPVEVAGKVVELKGEKLVLVVVRDISERKRAELELKSKVEQLEEFHNVTVGRELKMIELEKEIDALLLKLGQPAKYRT